MLWGSRRACVKYRIMFTGNCIFPAAKQAATVAGKEMPLKKWRQVAWHICSLDSVLVCSSKVCYGVLEWKPDPGQAHECFFYDLHYSRDFSLSSNLLWKSKVKKRSLGPLRREVLKIPFLRLRYFVLQILCLHICRWPDYTWELEIRVEGRQY